MARVTKYKKTEENVDSPADMEMCLNCKQKECTNCLTANNRKFTAYKENMIAAGREAELPPETPKEDSKVKPGYYKRDGIECYAVQKLFCKYLPSNEAIPMSNIVKYLWRYRDKNGLEDLKKARQYLERLIKEYEDATD